jgi:hypothetical protein
MRSLFAEPTPHPARVPHAGDRGPPSPLGRGLGQRLWAVGLGPRIHLFLWRALKGRNSIAEHAWASRLKLAGRFITPFQGLRTAAR